MEFNIIFIVLALLFWVVKQIVSFNKKTANKPQGADGESNDPYRKSFEDILKQFALENREHANKTLAEEKRSKLTKEDVIEQNAFSKYQGANPQDLKVDMSVKQVRRRNVHYRIKKKKKNPYLKMFQNPDSVKKAFVGSLIFERKKY